MNNVVVPASVLERKRRDKNLEIGIAFALELFSEAKQYQKDWVFQEVPPEFFLLMVSSAQKLCEILSGKTGEEAFYRVASSLTDSGKRHLYRAMDVSGRLLESGAYDLETKERMGQELFKETFSFLREFLIQCGRVSVVEVETHFRCPSLATPSFTLGGITFTTA